MFDSTKNVGLCFQHSDTDLIIMVEQIDDMKLTYQFCYQKFKASPEFMFELPHKTFLNDIIIDGNDVTYHGAKLMRFDPAKQIL